MQPNTNGAVISICIHPKLPLPVRIRNRSFDGGHGILDAYCAVSKICVLFRKETGVLFSVLVKIGLRKEKDALQPESGLLSGITEKERLNYEQQ